MKTRQIHYSLNHYKSGICSVVQSAITAKNNTSNFEIKKRGKIKIFSAKSRQNLREKILTLTSNLPAYACTYTFPGKILSKKKYLRLWDSWAKNYICRIDSAQIWRAELQSRGQIHYHTILFTPHDVFKIQMLWRNFLKKNKIYDKKSHYKYTLKIEKTDSESWIWETYLFNHATKQKKNQIIKSGRHWGVTNRKLLYHGNYQPCYLPRRQYYQLIRAIKKLLNTRRHCSHGRSIYFCRTSINESIKKYEKFLLDNLTVFDKTVL